MSNISICVKEIVYNVFVIENHNNLCYGLQNPKPSGSNSTTLINTLFIRFLRVSQLKIATIKYSHKTKSYQTLSPIALLLFFVF